VAALTDMPKLQAGYVGIALLRRDKALILAKNVLYIITSDEDEKCRYGCAPPSREPYFSRLHPSVLKEGVNSTREQWQENRVKKLRKVPPV
jgi:hypothetical protein